MTVHVSVDRAQLLGTQRKLEPELYRGPVEELIRDASVFATREAREGARGLGAVADSLHAEAHGFAMRISSRNPAAIIAEFGRRPGAKAPPPNAFARYGDESVRFAIARAVARRGLKGRFFIRRTRERLRSSELPRLVALAAKKIGSKWTER